MRCFALLCVAFFCFVALCFVVLSIALLCVALLCFVLLCFAVRCFALLCFVLLCCFALLCSTPTPLDFHRSLFRRLPLRAARLPRHSTSTVVFFVGAHCWFVGRSDRRSRSVGRSVSLGPSGGRLVNRGGVVSWSVRRSACL